MNSKRWAALTLAAGLLSMTGCAMFGDSSGGSGGGGFFSRMGRGGGCFGGGCFAGGGSAGGEVVSDGYSAPPVSFPGAPGCPCSNGAGIDGSPVMVVPSGPTTTTMPAMPNFPNQPPMTLPSAPPPRIAPIPQATPMPYTP